MEPFRFLTGTVIPVADKAALGNVPTVHLPWCFGCGPENDNGLRLRPRFNGDLVEADIQFAPRFQGGPGLVHGGAISAFFDDLMGFVMMVHQRPAVTAKLEINYLKPIPLGITLHGTAWLSDQEGRKMWAEAVGEDDHANRYIESKALFLPVMPDHFADTMQYMDPEQAAKLSRYDRDEYYP
jgi:acyl-coenzyme A thioesterase PaaI-like protein